VIAQRTPAAVAGLLHLPQKLPIYKGPVSAAISADDVRPCLICFSSTPNAPSLLGRIVRALFWRPRAVSPIYKRPVSVAVFGHPPQKGP
jgi:hypothetical protein